MTVEWHSNAGTDWERKWRPGLFCKELLKTRSIVDLWPHGNGVWIHCHCIICHLCNNTGSCKSRPENEVWHRIVPSTSSWSPRRSNEDAMNGSAQAACYLSPSPFICLVSYCNWEQDKCKFYSCLVQALSCLFSLLSALQQGIIWQSDPDL